MFCSVFKHVRLHGCVSTRQVQSDPSYLGDVLDVLRTSNRALWNQLSQVQHRIPDLLDEAVEDVRLLNTLCLCVFIYSILSWGHAMRCCSCQLKEELKPGVFVRFSKQTRNCKWMYVGSKTLHDYIHHSSIAQSRMLSNTWKCKHLGITNSCIQRICQI